MLIIAFILVALLFILLPEDNSDTGIKVYDNKQFKELNRRTVKILRQLKRELWQYRDNKRLNNLYRAVNTIISRYIKNNEISMIEINNVLESWRKQRVIISIAIGEDNKLLNHFNALEIIMNAYNKYAL